MAFCPHCMAQLGGTAVQSPVRDDLAICPRCGGDLRYTAAAHHIPVGTLLRSSSGHTFRFGAAKGEGGFGITYIAEETVSRKAVAIKEYFPIRCMLQRGAGFAVLPRPDLEEIYRGGLRSFLREASMLQAVRNIPSIVQVLDYFEANNTAYLIMEYLNGHTLSDRMIKAEKCIPAEVLLPMMHPLMRDLYTLHNANVIHRDIAPDNIMWMPDGTLKLLDFGCARSMEDGKSATVLLKPGFAPVEQYQTKGQGPYTDVYALCATIYYCVTGKRPPAAPERAFARQEGQPDPLLSPSALGVLISPEQEQTLLWGMTLQPTTRPQDMKILAERFFRAPFPPIQGFSGPDPIPDREQVDPARYATMFGTDNKNPVPASPTSNPTIGENPVSQPGNRGWVQPGRETIPRRSASGLRKYLDILKNNGKPAFPSNDKKGLLIGILAAAAVIVILLATR